MLDETELLQIVIITIIVYTLILDSNLQVLRTEVRNFQNAATNIREQFAGKEGVREA